MRISIIKEKVRFSKAELETLKILFNDFCDDEGWVKRDDVLKLLIKKKAIDFKVSIPPASTSNMEGIITTQFEKNYKRFLEKLSIVEQKQMPLEKINQKNKKYITYPYFWRIKRDPEEKGVQGGFLYIQTPMGYTK